MPPKPMKRFVLPTALIAVLCIEKTVGASYPCDTWTSQIYASLTALDFFNFFNLNLIDSKAE